MPVICVKKWKCDGCDKTVETDPHEYSCDGFKSVEVRINDSTQTYCLCTECDEQLKDQANPTHWPRVFAQV